MPQILVMTNPPDGRESVMVMQERVGPLDLDSEHFSAQLIERLGWALVDADDVEQTSEANRLGAPAGRKAA